MIEGSIVGVIKKDTGSITTYLIMILIHHYIS